MTAAIAAATEGACVTIYERNDRLGKKILATGNGKCNLGNLQLSIEDYHSDNLPLVEACLAKFGTEETIAFFEKLGLMVREKNGYLYPVSEQAAAVLDVLRMAVERLGIKVLYDTKVNHIARRKDGQLEVGWDLETSDRQSAKINNRQSAKAVYDRVIIACGSKAAPKTGSDGSGYKLAKQMGLTVTPVMPALVQLKCQEDFCKAISGIRTDAGIHILNGKKFVTEERGELQLTEYGISGIPVFQLSGQVNKLLRDGTNGKLVAHIDFLPDVTEAEWQEFGNRRIEAAKAYKDMTVEGFFTGMLHKKLMTLFLKMAGLKTNIMVKDVPRKQLMDVFSLCKNFSLHIVGSNSYDNAQICTGGVSMKEVTGSLEAVSVKGLYFAGEVLDVDGRCGGYNLQWAWTSGYLAGKAAAGNNPAENPVKEAI